MPTWSRAGYDLGRTDRGLYLFLDPSGVHGLENGFVCQTVKLGLVLSPTGFNERLRRIVRN